MLAVWGYLRSAHYRRRHVWVDAELHSAGVGVVPNDDPEVAACFFIWRALSGTRPVCHVEST